MTQDEYDDDEESMSNAGEAPTTPLTMQEAILALQRFWTDAGCMIVQPFNTEVGAGTANPATALRVLGPEPWRVAYVEPSVRPDDSRYGDNPNRLQTHTQFQVILKPDPGNPQELYLASLQALGIDLNAHDVRFVEDNWASPALGAWGLGWEVWLDGMEITQFTYFQQAGGLSLDPVSVEVTYGLERILMALQGVSHFKEIAFAPGIAYGEVFSQAEYEMSRYYLDDADVATNRQLFDSYAAEARRMLDLKLPVPAYTYALRCSHTFNVLDSRGAISTTERATAFRTMRGLTREVAQLWVERREQLGHPLGVAEASAPATLDGERPELTEPADLLFEIGFEELPWTEVAAGIAQVRDFMVKELGKSRLAHGEVRVDGTPRRLVVTVDQVAPREEQVTQFDRGPKAAVAFDDEGRPTPAALGFCRSRNTTPDLLETVDVEGIAYVGITRALPGRTAAEVLQQLLPDLVRKLRSPKNMRWGDPELTFSRPIRWLLARLGTHELPLVVSSLRSGTTTRVLRTAEEPVVDVPAASGYAEFLAEHDIVLSRDERRTAVVDGAVALAAEVGGTIDLEAQTLLVEEITDLVESPNLLLASFDAAYMDLPTKVLTTVMSKHQRYLAVTDSTGALLPYVIVVANGTADLDTVRRGNEAVLRARYEDARFFFEADLAIKPEELRGRLVDLNFETLLGTMADRAARIAQLADWITARAGLEPSVVATVERAGALAKFDLTSQMVIEMSSLAGVMAQEYAVRAGEPADVALALAEMEMPSTGQAKLPQSQAGTVLSLADRFDLLVGMVAVGNVPTGHSDPFGVRRAAAGLVQVLRFSPQFEDVPIEDGIAAAVELLRKQGVDVADDVAKTSETIVLRRYELLLSDGGANADHVRAVMPRAGTPGRSDADLHYLASRAQDADFQELTAAVQRVLRILPSVTDVSGESAPLSLDEELALDALVTSLEQDPKVTTSLASFDAAAGDLARVINAFFDAVLVMDQDPQVRAARVGLLLRLANVAQEVLDWSAL